MKTNAASRSGWVLALTAVVALVAALWSPALLGDSAILTTKGTLYEVFPAYYGDVVAGAAGTTDARLPVLALRTMPPGGPASLEVVPGTGDPDEKGQASVEFDEITGTVFVCYTKSQGLMSVLHIAIKRDERWVEHDVLPNLGLYLSLNPQMVVSRQRYIVFDAAGTPIPKNRSILSIVWWEESGGSQARYAPVFVEDGVLYLDSVQAYNLNELAGAAETTPIPPVGLSFASYQYPAIQRDPTSNGGVLVSFVNFSAQQHMALSITFPDDITKLVAAGATVAPPEALARLHKPIGRTLAADQVPTIDTTDAIVGTAISPSGLSTFFWIDGPRFRFLRSDTPDGAKPMWLPIRPDFSADRAETLIREMAAKQ